MKKLATCVIGMAMAVMVAGTLADAANDLTIRSSAEIKPGSVLNIGDQATFWYGGNEAVRNFVSAGETIPVFKETPVCGLTKRTEVGAVRVLAYKGEHRFLARVVDGRLANGDIALKEVSR